MKKQIILLLFVLLVLFSVASVSAEDNQTIDNLSSKSISVSGNTFADINNAINSEVSGGTVYLNNATYSGNSEIVINKNIIINGASGTRADSVSILDAGNSTRIFKIVGSHTVTLKNLVLINALAINSGSGEVARGSVLYAFNAKTINLYNCVFESNTALEGGAVFVQGQSSTHFSNLNVVNCTFRNNNGSSGAGALFVYNANANIKDSNFINNTALKGNSTGNAGGAIYNYGKTDINNCLFEDNTGLYAGAIVNEQYTLSVTNSKFIANVATANSGSAIFNFDPFSLTNVATLKVNNCTFEYNVANDKGSGIYNYIGNVQVDNSTFIHNRAKSAALLFNDGGEFIINNSNFIGNVGSNGSVIYNQNCTYLGVFMKEGFLSINNSNFNYNVPINGTELYNEGNLKLSSSNLTGNYTLIQNYGSLTLDDNDLNSESYLSVYNDGGIIVNPLTLIVLDNSTVKSYINKSVSISAILLDANNNTIGDTSFKFILNGTDIVPVLYKNGTYKENVSLSKSGLYPVTASINSNADKYKLENGLLEILPQPNLEIRINNITYLENATVNIISPNLTDDNVNIIIKKANGTIVYNSFNVINNDFKISNLDSGNYTAVVNFTGNGNYSPVSNSTVFEVKSRGTIISVVVDNKKCNSTVNGTITLTDNKGNPLTGIVNVTIGNWTANITVIDGKASFTVDDNLTADNYTATVKFNGTDNYFGSENNTNFTVTRIATILEIDIPDSIRYDNITGFVYLKDADGNPINGIVNITIETDEFSVNVVDGVANFTFDAVRSGIFNVTGNYSGNWMYESTNYNTTFEVGKIRTMVEIKIPNIVYGQNITGSILVTAKDKSSISSNVTVDIAGENITVPIIFGKGNFTIAKILPVGNNYKANVSFNISDDKYYASVSNTTFNVDKINTTIAVDINNVTYGESVLGNISLIDMFGNNVTGEVVLTIGGKNITVPVNNGKGSFNITDLNAGNYTIAIDFNGTNIYANVSTNSSFRVTKAIPRLIIIVDNITYGNVAICKVYLNNATETISLFNAIDLSNPSVNLTVNNKTYTVDLNNGFGSVSISNLNVGTYTALAKFVGDEDYLSITNTTNFQVKARNALLNITIDNKTYGDEVTGEIKVVDDNGNPLDGIVNLTVDGKTFNVAINNGTGNIKLNSTLNPGNYSVSGLFNAPNYENVSNTTTFTVRPINITVSNITIPKGTNGTVNITLSNPINTTVNVLFNGKNYQVAIKNGVGSFIIPDTMASGNYTVNVTLANQIGLGFVEIISYENSTNITSTEENFTNINNTNTNNTNNVKNSLIDLKTANPILLMLLALFLIPVSRKFRR